MSTSSKHNNPHIISGIMSATTTTGGSAGGTGGGGGGGGGSNHQNISHKSIHGSGGNHSNNNYHPSIVTSNVPPSTTTSATGEKLTSSMGTYPSVVLSSVLSSSSSSSLNTSNGSTAASSSNNTSTNTTLLASSMIQTPFWEYDQGQSELEYWIQQDTLPSCFPSISAYITTTTATTGSNTDPYSNSNNSSNNLHTNHTSISTADKQYYQQQKKQIIQLFWQHLQKALQSIQLKPNIQVHKTKDDDNNEDSKLDHDTTRMRQQQKQQQKGKKAQSWGPPARKKAKITATTIDSTSTKVSSTKWKLIDPYHVWKVNRKNNTISPKESIQKLEDEVEGKVEERYNNEEQEEEYDPSDIPDTWGGRLAQLSVGGLCNALALQHVMTKPHPISPIKVTSFSLSNDNDDTDHNSDHHNRSATTAAGVSWTMWELWYTAHHLHAAIQARVKLDILQMTPIRIQQMLAPECTLQEIASMRKRIYDTVVLGKGLHQDDGLDDDPDGSTGLVTAGTMSSVHDAEKYKKCPNCGNNDQSEFALDRKNGDIICILCGTIVSESLMHESSAYRKFEGEADRNHHGDAPNRLYSSGHNLSTGLSGTGGGGSHINGWGSMGAKGNLETILRNAHAYTELNVSQFGKNDRRTRTGYKDRQKKDAFVQMQHTGDALSLHEAVIQRAKELFAGFRDDRELVQQFKGVLAACLIEAFEQLSKEGRNTLKQQQQYEGDGQRLQQQQNETDTLASNVPSEPSALPAPSARASRRNELHHATLAGCGGLVLDFSNLSQKNKTLPPDQHRTAGSSTGCATTETTTPSRGIEDKAAASWNLEDCRSWLLEVSRRIAQQWIEERNSNLKSVLAKRFPATITLEELEGQLVEYSIALCEHLENELQARNGGLGSGGVLNQKRVNTPRVKDMSRLMIQWQHAHERGSGGKGGVGGSGATNTSTGSSIVSTRVPAGPQRTAGQILVLQTAKKLGSIFSDSLAGEAFHKELRGVIGRQEARKRKELLDEATRQRLQQMKRKPWLQARITE